MSAFVSAARRIAGNGIVQDVCALVAIVIFIFVAGFMLAEVSQAVSAGRAMQ